MTRRGFFRVLTLATVTAPVTAGVLPAKLAEVRHWWLPTTVWEKEFDFGNAVGIAGEFRNVLSGARVRNAVRYRLPPNDRQAFYPRVRREARTLLRAWADELPAWRLRR